jgi:hypothetical protein
MNLRLSTAAVLASVAALAGCAGASAPATESPVRLTAVKAADGTPIKQVELANHAIQRLGITTGTVHNAAVTLAGVAGEHKVVPYSAVVYDSDGSSWTYVNTAPRTYLRQRITILEIRGEVAVLTAGPADGTVVVTRGAPELLGAEAEIAGEE